MSRHEIYDLAGAYFVKLSGVCFFKSCNISCKLDYRNLHTQAYAKIRDNVFSCKARGKYHALDTSVAEAAGNENSVKIRKGAFVCVRGQGFRVYPADIYACAQGAACMAQSLCNRKIGVVKLYVFAYKPDGYAVLCVFYGVYHSLPLREVCGRG